MKTITISPETMQARIARFAEVKPSRETQPSIVPDVVTKLLIPRALYPMMGPPGADSPIFKFATHGPEGFSATICEVDPGDGPALHAHQKTEEIFLVLDGCFRIEWGDDGEHAVTLDRFDTIAVPPKVVRRFENIGEQRAYLLAIVLGGAESITEVEYTPAVGEQVKALAGQATYDLLTGAGVRFDAGVEVGK